MAILDTLLNTAAQLWGDSYGLDMGSYGSPDYRVQIRTEFNNQQIILNALMPENIAIGAGSAWEARMPASLRQFLGAGVLGNLSQASNLDLVSQTLTYQSWQSSAPIEFNLTFLFDAQTDAFTDVVSPMLTLQMLSLPYRLEGQEFMLPPGPSIFDPDRGRISIRIGRFMYIHSVIIVQVNNVFDTRLDRFGQPISGQCEITIRTINTPTREDLRSFFLAGDLSAMNTSYGSTIISRNALTNTTPAQQAAAATGAVSPSSGSSGLYNLGGLSFSGTPNVPSQSPLTISTVEPPSFTTQVYPNTIPEP